jgi:tripartite-type tricarboxylate transporter receptor subunit TctC
VAEPGLALTRWRNSATVFTGIEGPTTSTVALLPQVPTFDEVGVKGYVIDTWYGLLAPAGTPPEAIRVLTREATEFAQSPAVRERLAGAGLEPQGSCGEPFSAQLAREIDANARLARELNLKAE